MNTSPSRAAFLQSLQRTIRRWRALRVLQGALVVTCAFAVLGALVVPWMDASHFAPSTVSTARIVVWVCVLALALWFIVLRVPWRGQRMRLVHHLHSDAARGGEPAADAHESLLLTAVQMDARGDDAPLVQRLYTQAARLCEDPFGVSRSDRQGVRRSGAALVAVVLLLVVVALLLGEGARHGVHLLLAPWRDAQQAMPYHIVVEPGDAKVRERTDFTVRATTMKFVPGELVLWHRAVDQTHWSRISMQGAESEAGRETGVSRDVDASLRATFQGQLLSVEAPFEYYLAADNVRSATHRVQVQWLPRIERMDHVYRFPAYTGLAERRVEAATDIAAVSGASVEVRVLPGVPGAATTAAARDLSGLRGTLVLDDTTRRDLLRDGDALVASLSVDEATRYRIELSAPATDAGVADEANEAAMVPVTPDHAIAALADGAPRVTLARPASDARVTAIEEVAVEVEADDDVSLRRVELVYSINGEPEQVVDLSATGNGRDPAGAGEPASMRATHTLFLEQRELHPGDVISVHARASDGVVARTAVTDIQFIEVRPFDRDYRRGRSGGRGGGGGGRQNEESLAAQQRDLVVALFRLARDSRNLDTQEQQDRLTTLSAAQQRIRERVEAIVRRIKGRAVVQNTPGYRVMLDVMPKAVTAMARVEALLAVPDAEQALPPAREALGHLQRADAAFREVQVASRQGGGGGGGNASNNDLSRLFELEMDRFRNRYSQVQRAQAPQRQQQVDETLDKLKELARRQREEIERARRRAQRPSRQASSADSGAAGNASAGGASTQQALAQALEELIRRLERLQREQPGASLDTAREAMQQAAQAMRRATAAQQSSASSSPQQSSASSSPQQSGASSSPQQSGASSSPQQPGASSSPQQPGASSSPQQGQGQQAGQRSAQQSGQQSGQPSGQARSGGGASGNASNAEQAAREAFDRLQAARKALAGDARDQTRRDIQQAEQRARSLVRRQELVEQRLRGAEGAAQARGDASPTAAPRDADAAGGDGPTPARDDGDRPVDTDMAASGNAEDGARARSGDDGSSPGDAESTLDELKQRMQSEARELREQLDRIAGATTGASEVRDPARRAGAVMREEDVEGRLRRSRQQLADGDVDEALESSIAEALQRVQQQVAVAAAAAAEAQDAANPAADAALSNERLREMMRELAQLREQVRRREGTSGDARARGESRAEGAQSGDRAEGAQSGDRAEGAQSGNRTAGAQGGNRTAGAQGGNRAAGARGGAGGGGRAQSFQPGPGGRGSADLRGLASDLERLFGPVARNDGPVGDLRTLVEGIEALAASDAGASGVATLAWLDALAQVERLLKARADAGQSAMPSGREAQVPRRYRSVVETYFRRLGDVAQP